jgi:hypothetical protein
MPTVPGGGAAPANEPEETPISPEEEKATVLYEPILGSEPLDPDELAALYEGDDDDEFEDDDEFGEDDFVFVED